MSLTTITTLPYELTEIILDYARRVRGQTYKIIRVCKLWKLLMQNLLSVYTHLLNITSYDDYVLGHISYYNTLTKLEKIIPGLMRRRIGSFTSISVLGDEELTIDHHALYVYPNGKTSHPVYTIGRYCFINKQYYRCTYGSLTLKTIIKKMFDMNMI